ncbi:MAG: hypothetical protein HUU50_05755 [Candidatus Brocadiae bacterium]|nr:hypothetical protein [Candidatus Brocadiia bacterium]
MEETNVFPRELLSQPPGVRLAYFQNKIIAHPRLKEAHNNLINAICHPAGASIILVLVPTGVGKTTLRLRVEKYLIEKALTDLKDNLGGIPVASIEAVAPDSGNFSWRDYYMQALMALDEPLIEHKIDYGVEHIRRDSKGRMVLKDKICHSIHHDRKNGHLVMTILAYQNI